MKYLFILLLSSTLFAASVDRLKEGNERFVSGNLEHPRRDQERRDETKLVQKPFAVILACADSRLAPEIIFDEGIGDLFVVRLAGNVAGPLAVESISYAVHVLGCDTIVVMGHENCGAVDAVLKKQDGSIPKLADLIKPAARKYPKDLKMAIEQNALHQRHLLMRSESLKKAVRSKKVEVLAAYYDLPTGKVTFLK